MITYKNGDILSSTCNVICHQVNCQGVMGSGIAKTIREKFPRTYVRYIERHKKQGSKLGDLDISYEEIGKKKLYIANLYSQYHYLPHGVCHTDYDAFRTCLKQLKSETLSYEKNCRFAKGHQLPTRFKIGFPDHIGCGLAGGDWEIVKSIIEEEFADAHWDVEIWKLISKK